MTRIRRSIGNKLPSIDNQSNQKSRYLIILVIIVCKQRSAITAISEYGHNDGFAGALCIQAAFAAAGEKMCFRPLDSKYSLSLGIRPLSVGTVTRRDATECV